jgi:DNA adenine methylase
VFFNVQKEKSFLSDINEELINVYQVIKTEPKKLIKFLESCKHSKEFYAEIRAWDRTENWQEKYTKIQRA